MNDTTHITLTVGQLKGLLPLANLGRLIAKNGATEMLGCIILPVLHSADGEEFSALIGQIREYASHSHLWDILQLLNEQTKYAEAGIPQHVSMDDLRRVLEFATYGSLMAYYPDEQQLQADVLQLLQRDDYRGCAARLFRALSLPFGPPG